MEFLDWLKQQSYWVSRDELDKEFEVYYMNMEGVTMKKGEDGETLIPRRDLRKGYFAGRIVVEE